MIKAEVLKYKGYQGSIEFSVEDLCLHGRLLFIDDLVTYEAETVQELKKAFEESVDDYIETCRKFNREAQKPYKGSLNIRPGSALHKEAAEKAFLRGVSINEYIKFALKNEIERDDSDSFQRKQKIRTAAARKTSSTIKSTRRTLKKTIKKR